MDLYDQTDLQPVYSVSELNAEIRELIETSLPVLWVRGEISNFTHHSSGHMYFSLKDEQSQISCVMWKSRAIQFAPADGTMVRVFGNIRMYEKRGTIQIDVIKMIPAGVGDLQMAFEALKRRLFEEGLFDEEYKKPIPEFPETIGIVTSPTGAAIRDIRQVISRRFPSVQLILAPAIVQGDDAPASIVEAIRTLNEHGKADVLIVGRGGGSLEDLWAFNDERVARAIFNSTIPVISAVGHEIDTTISDYVADLRAPTPSAAAELAVPDRLTVIERVRSLQYTIEQALERRLRENRQRLEAVRNSYGFRKPADILFQHRQRLDELEQSIQVTVKHVINLLKQQLLLNSRRIEGLSPHSVLKRGYSITRLQDSDKLVKSISDVSVDDRLITVLPDGSLLSQTLEINQKNDGPEPL